MIKNLRNSSNQDFLLLALNNRLSAKTPSKTRNKFELCNCQNLNTIRFVNGADPHFTILKKCYSLTKDFAVHQGIKNEKNRDMKTKNSTRTGVKCLCGSQRVILMSLGLTIQNLELMPTRLKWVLPPNHTS